jgi:hypothetical protein
LQLRRIATFDRPAGHKRFKRLAALVHAFEVIAIDAYRDLDFEDASPRLNDERLTRQETPSSFVRDIKVTCW